MKRSMKKYSAVASLALVLTTVSTALALVTRATVQANKNSEQAKYDTAADDMVDAVIEAASHHILSNEYGDAYNDATDAYRRMTKYGEGRDAMVRVLSQFPTDYTQRLYDEKISLQVKGANAAAAGATLSYWLSDNSGTGSMIVIAGEERFWHAASECNL